MRTAALTALEREDAYLPRRLADAMVALQAGAAAEDPAVVRELLGTATDISGPLLDRLHDDVVARIAGLLRATGVEAQWRGAGLSADQLAEHLYLITPAVAQSGRDGTQQYEALYTAALIVARGHCG
ncbi:hypothetical protein [Streptomyces mayonensis]|uniref:hypothetical protein n=1 Tax=Streptomyces mayonensis TaxID=2750816 RepID=UPI001C1DE0AB|nr:hypothetical protein [Streptomyces sp. A108]MBU6531385.1 hypothetical protein [Streptomyces sp. A108]